MSPDEDVSYVDFASLISFFDFEGIEEYEDAFFDLSTYQPEMTTLRSRHTWDIASLSDYLKRYPRSFWLFEGLLQLRRFTNAQLFHFLFDIEILNCGNMDRMYDYAVSNLNQEKFLKELLAKKHTDGDQLRLTGSGPPGPTKSQVVASFKIVVSDYVEALSKKSGQSEGLAETRIANSPGVAERVAKYILDYRHFNEILQTVNVKDFLETKRIPKDTKGLHGEAAKQKVLNVLDRNGFVRTELTDDGRSLRSSPKMYATEASLAGIKTKKDNKVKRFDVVILLNSKPTHLVEVNFYTTIGTKIGINEDEYTDLASVVRARTPFRFIWITDGNYWLTGTGERMYKRLFKTFDGIYNINS